MAWLNYLGYWAVIPVCLLLVYLTTEPWIPARPTLRFKTVRWSIWFPACLNRLFYMRYARSMLAFGYMRYPDKPFRILKLDGDLVVLPRKYLDELKSLHPSQASLLDARFINMMGEYTDAVPKSDLAYRTVIEKLTPNLCCFLCTFLAELDQAFKTVVPDYKDTYARIDLYDAILKLTARSTSRLMIGEGVAGNEKWLDSIVQYTYDFTSVVSTLRQVPAFIRPWVARCLPSVRRLKAHSKWMTEELILPMISSRRYAEHSDRRYVKPGDFLQWMMDTAETEFDRDPRNLAHHLILTMALNVVNTSASVITHAMYDLLLRPEYAVLLRGEIAESLGGGWLNALPSEFHRMRLLDSFLRESLRLNPVSEVCAPRIVKHPFTLSDGTHLPTGTQICFPSGPMARDPAELKNPFAFDGFRWSRDASARGMSFSVAGPANMHFGLSPRVCPGRFFGGYLAKAIMSRFVLDYDLKFLPGQKGRPGNVSCGELNLPGRVVVLVKKRVD
ncbi:cytochrome P450 [Aspergillus avenaceus]|uniref:Cytochrome P450 n=1 Tax=Aspergillus avenaceus TaxID=36643 RepID=A0A5N6TVU8_ASPAV|nr:cytochrome P450 [Aspergillus avenaceus]